MYVRVYVCVCEREREGKRVKNGHGGPVGRASNGGWCTRDVIASTKTVITVVEIVVMTLLP